MKNCLLLILLAIANCCFSETSNLVSYELKATYTIQELETAWKKNKISELIVPIRYAIDVYEVIYNSSWHDGSTIKASGLYFVPKANKDFPTIVYHHGTQVKKERKIKMSGEQAICIGMATDGYFIARPDYIGLGLGEKFHLYQHAESEAIASVDMLRAVDEINKFEGFGKTEHLFLTGYSQGGHATLAAHKYIQENLNGEMEVTASSPMSGAYDMSGAQSHTMFEPYSHPGYLPYLLITYHEVYDLFPYPLSEALKSPYDKNLLPLFNGENTFGAINAIMPEIPKDIVKDELVKQYSDDPNFPLKKALEANNVFDWKPNAPVQLCYCTEDEQVHYSNSQVAFDKMKALGAKRVIKRNGGKFDHNTCALYAAIYSKMFFDSIKHGKIKGRKGPVFKRFLLTLSKPRVKKMSKK